MCIRLFVLLFVVPNNRTAITISMSAVRAPSLGQSLRIQCTCIVSETVGGSSARPVLQWLNGDGSDIANGDGVILDGPNFQSTQTTLTLVFNVLHTSHAGRYVCRSSLTSPALPSPLVKTEDYNISVQSELMSGSMCTLATSILVRDTVCNHP